MKMREINSVLDVPSRRLLGAVQALLLVQKKHRPNLTLSARTSPNF